MSRRTERLARAIREVVSSTVLFGLRDPRVKNVTVLDVEVAGDMRSAKVRVSVLGDERAESLAIHGLNAARGYLQSKLGDRVELRYTPVLSFEIDDAVKKSIEASRILREIEEREGPFGGEDENAVAENAENAGEGEGEGDTESVESSDTNENENSDTNENVTNADGADDETTPPHSTPDRT